MNIAKQQQTSSHFEITIELAKSFATVKLYGDVDLNLINNAYLGLINHSSFRTNMNALYDYTNAFIETSIQDVESHAAFVQQFVKRRGENYKVAMVANETLNSALLNVYRLKISKTNVEAEVFASTRPAAQWLKL